MISDLQGKWIAACDRAKRNVVGVRSEMQADYAIDAAHELLAVAHKLKGVACPKCGGQGSRIYGSGSTWRGGMGTAAMTRGVCDVCWGTGRTDETGLDRREMEAQMRTLKTESSRRWFEDRIGAKLKMQHPAFLAVAQKLRKARWGGDFWATRTAETIANVGR